MQIEKVVVLHKKGDRNDINNYGPVSLLPVFFERIRKKTFHSRLTALLEKHKVITYSHIGFRKKRSTELGLLDQK